ncbi:GNAT family N-acetyltransferase [Pseudalkalibacillus sp. Hm43]|uniref:GNAT family N-acetyltransferase n=1 Tax=Pseudalkalibacillus sp. Hm43 TaxID=3450742 RepID=UPI003F4243AF
MIVSGNLLIRTLVEEDSPYLVKWLNDPEILKWYEGRDQPHEIGKVKEHFFSKSNERVKRNIILLDGNEIGYVQYYPLSDEEKRVYGYKKTEKIFGMDQFIGETSEQDKGIGTKMILAVVQYLFEEKEAEIIAMDPQLRNKRAIHCYEKCGFIPVKILVEHELHEGIKEDCLLIEKRKG